MKRVVIVLLSICLVFLSTGCVKKYPKPEEPPVYFTGTLDDFLKNYGWNFDQSFYEKWKKKLVKEAFQTEDIGDGCTMLRAQWDCCNITIFCKGEKIYRVDIEGDPNIGKYHVISKEIFQRDINYHVYAVSAALSTRAIGEWDWMYEELPIGEVREEEKSGVRLRVERADEKREFITLEPLAES